MIASWRDRFTQLGRPRRSTVVLSVVFVLTLLLYLWVRPDPPPRAGRATADVPEAVTTTEPPPSTDTDPATTTTRPAADTTVTASTTPTTAASDTTAPRSPSTTVVPETTTPPAPEGRDATPTTEPAPPETTVPDG